MQEAFCAQVFVEVKSDLAVGTGAKAVALLLQGGPDPREVVELAVDDDVESSVFAGDRLGALRIVDREESVTKSRPSRRRNPGALSVRTTVAKRGGYTA